MASRIAAILVLLAVAGCEPATPVQPIGNPAGTEAFAPRLFQASGRTGLSWLESGAGGHALRYALWTGDGWSEARTVATGDDWFANWADVPGVHPLGGGGWLAWWLRKSADTAYAYDVELAVSGDGREWQHTGSPHHDGTPTEHGFVAAFDTNNGFGLLWLDGRNTTAASGNAHHHAGGMSLRYGLFDAAGMQHKEAVLDMLVCDCCQTDAAVLEGGVIAVYRDRADEEIRDIKAARFVDGAWQAPVSVHADGWKIDGCPVNGPAVAASGQKVAVAWFTAAAGEAMVRAALSDDGGRSFSAPLQVSAGEPLGRVDVVWHPDYGALVTWMERRDGRTAVWLRGLDPDRWPGGSVRLVDVAGTRASGFPRVAWLEEDGRLLLAWTEQGPAGRKVLTGTLQLPR